ncbi:purine-binding chemotaxis protein CheW, partial [Candidatus Aerophobetes bacterium]|nr:purine-binding chemotaxis protein CheW [Candidatus Aerophobetes bacterium]
MAVNTERQLVSFKIAGQEFGLDIGEVQEIIKIPEITRVPKAPEFVEGIINLRGGVLPVIDSRRRFNLEAGKQEDSNRILVVNVEGK